MLNDLKFLTLSSDEIADEKTIQAAVERLQGTAPETPVVFVAALGQTYKTLAEAGEKSADQDLVLASALAEGLRTYHMQLAQQVTSPAVFRETRSLLSGLFEELSDLLKGLCLLEEFTEQAARILDRYGERAAAIMVSHALRSRDVQSACLSTREIFQEPDDVWKEVQELVQKGSIPVLPLSLHGSGASIRAQK
ncbi:MAG: hypothetical protein EHM61_17195 [Acidobacteria bacterium]|nr:MAG: hypothetical protein EHM61_17195 [Acidobacteriota bacterium]